MQPRASKAKLKKAKQKVRHWKLEIAEFNWTVEKLPTSVSAVIFILERFCW